MKVFLVPVFVPQILLDLHANID